MAVEHTPAQFTDFNHLLVEKFAQNKGAQQIPSTAPPAKTEDTLQTSAQSATRNPAVPAIAGFEQLTPLQRHVKFFEQTGDNIVTLAETTQAFKKLGFGSIAAASSALFFNTAFGPLTSGSATLDIDLRHVERGKHPSSTGIYDQQGRFVQANFDRMFALYDANHSGSLDKDEISNMIAHNAKDRAGKLRSTAEFGLLFQIAAGKEIKDGISIASISRERLHQFYDGTLFYAIATEKAGQKR